MKLKAYRELRCLSVAFCASCAGVSEVCWRNWENGQRIPGKDRMRWIRRWSAEAVQPNDFYDPPAVQNASSHAS